jgi:hypothetical protein
MSGDGLSSLDTLVESIGGLTGLFEALIEEEIVASDSAVVQAAAAATSAADAATTATNVSTLAANASTAADTAATSATNANTEAIAATNAANAAAASATAAAASASAAVAAATSAGNVQTQLNTIYTVNTGGGTTVLTQAEFAAGIIVVEGELGNNAIIQVPADAHPFILDNATTGGYTVVLEMVGGTATASVTQGNYNQLVCDGATGVYSVSSVSGLQFNAAKPISGSTNVLTNQYQGAYTPMSNASGLTYLATLPQGSTMGIGGAVFLDALQGAWSIAPNGTDTADFGTQFPMNVADKAMFTWTGSGWRTTLYSNQISPIFKTSLTVPVGYITRGVFGGLADDGTTAVQATTGRFTTSLTVPTMAAGDNSFNAASTAYVYAAINALVGGAPAALDTLNALAAAINDETNFAAAVTNALAGKANITGQTFTGPVIAPTVTASTSMSSYGYGGNNNTGMLYLGNSGNSYLYFDGTNYNLANGSLYVNGQEVWDSGNFNPADYAALAGPATFQGEVVGTGPTGALRATVPDANQTSILLTRAGAPVDAKTWELLADNSGTFVLRAVNDAYSAESDVFRVTRPSGYTLGTLSIMPDGGRILAGGVTDDGINTMQVASLFSVQRTGVSYAQSIQLASQVGNSVTSYSDPSNAKYLSINSTTDSLNTPLTAGSLGIAFLIADQQVGEFSNDGNLLLGGSTDDGVNTLQVFGGIGIKGTGDGVTYPDGTKQSTAYVVTSPLINTYTPAAGVTTIATQAYGLGLIHVFEGGAYLVPGQDYTATTGNSITLTNAANGRNSYTVLTGALFNASNVLQPNVVNIPAVVGSTSITLPSTTMQGYLWIFQGAAWLQPGVDFTFAGGTAVTLLNAPTQSTDTFTLIMLQPVSFANTATQTNVQQAQLTFAMDTGVANSYSVNYIPAVGAPVNGMQLSFYVKTANTGAATLSCNGATAYPIYGNGHSPLSGSELIAGGFVEVVWNSILGAWVLLENTGGSQQNAGNLNFVGEAVRITADMSNSTGPLWKNNLAFQTSVPNGSTAVNALANGSGSSSQFSAFAASDPTNAAYATLAASTSLVGIYSGAFGSGVTTPFIFSIAGVERARFSLAGEALFGTTVSSATLLAGTGAAGTGGVALVGGSGYAAIQTGSNNSNLYLSKTAGFPNASVIDFLVNGATVGGVTTSGTAIAYGTTSDYRLKTNIAPLKGALDRLMLAKPIRYSFKSDHTQSLVDGFLAHELAEVVPEAVHGEKDAVEFHPVLKHGHDPKDVQPEDVLRIEEHIVPQLVDHSKVVPLLMAAVQELTLEVRSLRAELAAYKKK